MPVQKHNLTLKNNKSAWILQGRTFFEMWGSDQTVVQRLGNILYVTTRDRDRLTISMDSDDSQGTLATDADVTSLF